MSDVRILTKRGNVKRVPSWLLVLLLCINIAVIGYLAISASKANKLSAMAQEELKSYKLQYSSLYNDFVKLKEDQEALLENLATLENELVEIKENFELFKKEMSE